MADVTGTWWLVKSSVPRCCCQWWEAEETDGGLSPLPPLCSSSPCILAGMRNPEKLTPGAKPIADIEGFMAPWWLCCCIGLLLLLSASTDSGHPRSEGWLLD